MVRERNNMFIVYFSYPVTVYPAGPTRWGQVVRERNNMFIVYFSYPVTVYPAGPTRWGQVVRETNNMFIVYFSGPVTVYPAGQTRWGQVVRETNNMFIVYFSGQQVTVYPAGQTRWGQVVRGSHGAVEVYAWCVSEMREVLQAHTAASPVHQVTEVWMFISSDIGLSGDPSPPYRDLWADPADDSWSEEDWTSLLQAVPTTWGSEWLSIYVPFTAPLRGLLACLPSHLTQGRYIMVSYGTAGLGEVEAWVYTCQQAGLRVRLRETTILVPEGEEVFLRARRDRLCEAEDGEGRRMVLSPI